MKTVGFLTFDQLGHRSSASTRIRAQWLINYMPEAELFVYGKEYETVVLDKVFYPEWCELFPGKKILDVCDPVWFEGTVRLKETIEAVDAVTCPTEALAEVLRQLTDKPVTVIPDRHDPAYFTEQKTEHAEEIRTAVWYGYSDHAHALDVLKPELKKRGIKVTLVSDRHLTIPGLETEWQAWDVGTVNAAIVQADVALCPMGLSPAFAYKSNNRTVNAWFLGVPVVRTAADLERLATREAREAEAQANLEAAQKDWTADKSVLELRELIASL